MSVLFVPAAGRIPVIVPRPEIRQVELADGELEYEAHRISYLASHSDRGLFDIGIMLNIQQFAKMSLTERYVILALQRRLTATGDDNVLTAKSSEIAYRKEQLRRLQDEVIELEDVKTGISITDLGLNDFRMDLLNYVKENGDLDSMPNGLHAVVPANKDFGLPPGAIFALKNLHDSVNVDQQNRLHPYYLVYISNDGDVVADHGEVKRLLDLVRMSCKGLPGQPATPGIAS